jgi:hypothetical protein
MYRSVWHSCFMNRKTVVAFCVGLLCGFFACYHAFRSSDSESDYAPVRRGRGLGSLKLLPDPQTHGEFDLDMRMEEAQVWNDFKTNSHAGNNAIWFCGTCLVFSAYRRLAIRVARY